MKKLILPSLLGLFIFGVTPVNAQSSQKEQYEFFSGSEFQLNQLAQQGWKVRSATAVAENGQVRFYCVLYR
jgi:hypothetical protein